jgi:hypothetical protein
MRWLNRLPDSRRSAPGLEWAIWKRLPSILLWGTVVPLALAVLAWWLAPGRSAVAEDPAALLLTFRIIGLVVLHWTLVLTLAIGCGVVMVMKGSAFVADAYPLPEQVNPQPAARRPVDGR